MTELVVFPGGWPQVTDPARYGPNMDDLYAEQLQRCRRKGHPEFEVGTAGVLETLRCTQCGTRFIEEEM